ncbi:uncharacterized protein LOC135123361 isoform X2 [Zophobas morio]|uniref:uncharacterized protein LOC135123361 isoform X2 n=1 Tax=Zophobas morio TaxID=2755281 RepID=UPI003082AF9A
MKKIESFKKRSGTTDRGKEYEDVVLAFVILELVKDVAIKNFHVSSNEEGFGAFDDIVIKTESDKGNEIKAVQLKHTENRILSTKNLMSKTGDFSIGKYFKTFQEIKKDASEFILYTNRPFTYDDNTTFQLVEEEFSIITVKVKAASELAEIDSAYQFKIIEEDWNVEMLLKIREYQKFFSKFYLYTDQKKVESLKKSVTENFKTTYYSDEEIFEKFLKRLSEWNIQDGNKEKLNKKWMERVIALLLLSSHIEPLSSGSVNVNSGNDKVKIFQEAVSFFDITLLEKESYEKLKPVWDDIRKEKNFDFTELNKIRKRYFPAVSYIVNKNIDKIDPRIFIQLLWLTDKCPLIIRQHENVEKAIQLCPDKKFILIGEGKNEEWMKIYSVFQNLSNLIQKPDLHERIMQNFTISLQGKGEINLATAFGNSDKFLQSVTTDNLVEMLNDPCYIGGVKEILPEPYIERSLSRNIINIKYLKKFWKNTIIILNCADNFDKVKDELTQCKIIDINNFLQKKTQNFENQTNEIYVPKFNPTQYKTNFNSNKSNLSNTVYMANRNLTDLELEQIYNENREAKQIHYFKLSEDCNLEWIKTAGDVGDLELYKLSGKYCTTENELWSSRLDNNINLICGDPGIGKSELMKSFKNKCSPKYWTIMISPNDVHSFFDNSKFSKTTNSIDLFEKFIADEKCRVLQRLERRFFEMCVEKNHVIYVWDALDEIVGEHLDSVSKIIVGFSSKGFLQWVTSRRHLKPFLEKKFNLLALSINQLDEQEQQNYVRKRLASFISVDEIEIAIDKIKSSFAIIEHINILGIPLQIFMVTELFRQNKDKYLKLMENIFLLTDLYEYFIEEKFNNFYEGKLGFDHTNPHMKYRIREEKRKALDHYERMAFTVIFPEDILKRLNINIDKHREKILRKYASVGLVNEFQNNVPHFVHGSFAEYLVATYFSKNFNVIRDTLGDIIFDAKYNNVRFFFDLLLAKNSKAHVSVLYKNYELLKTYNDETLTRKDEGGRSVLHVISSWGQRHPRVKVTGKSGEYVVHEDNNFDKKAETQAYFEMVGYLQNKSTVDEHDVLLDMTPLAYARKSESLGAEIKLLQTKRNDLNRQLSTVDDVINIFYYSSLLGYDEVCELFTVEERKRRNHWYETKFVTAEHGETSLLLACGSGHLKVVKYLLQFDEEIEQHSNKIGETTIVDNPLECFVKVDAKVNRPTENGGTPLLVASEMGHEKVVEFLVSVGAEINRPMNDGFTPLLIASQNGHLKVVEYLRTVGAEINRANKEGGTPLFIASQMGHEKVVQYLATAGAELNCALKEGVTPLYIASERGHENIVEYLATIGAQINCATKEGATPLHVASQNGHERVVEYLATVGAEINRAMNDSSTPLYIASQMGHEKVVEYLATVGAEVNRPTKGGATPLYITSQMGHEKIVELLATVGAEINRAMDDSSTPLYIASQMGHEKVVEYLVAVGAEVNCAITKGATPLYIASQMGHEKVVECLATSGAEINRAGIENATSLYVASQNGHTKVVEYLVTVGAEINLATIDGETPVYIASQMGHEIIVDYLVTVGAEINRATKKGATPLYIASQMGHEKIVELLATVGAEINRAMDDSSTPLYIASQMGHEKVVELLATAGAEINRTLEDGMTPLYVASQNGHSEVVKYLAAVGADINRDCKEGVTPIYIASEQGHEKVVEYLAALGAEVNRATNVGGTPLFIASHNGHDRVVENLTIAGAEINCSMNDGTTPLYLASQNGHKKVVEHLVTAGAEVNRATNDGRTPLYIASQMGHEIIVDYLVTVGAEINRATKEGATPFFIASQMGHEKVVHYLATAGADINRAMNNGSTPLYIASQMGHEKVVECLATSGAEINRAVIENATSLYVASQNGHAKVVEYLVTVGAEINLATNNGTTPLYIASQNGHEKVVELLATAGAEINRATNDGMTPLYVASQNGHREVVKYLAAVGADINRDCKGGVTPIYIASQQGHEKVVEYLAALGAEVNRATNVGGTPLFIASHNGHDRVVENLTIAGAEINCSMNDGTTPLYLASQNGHRKIVEHLVTVGAEVHCATNDGETPLYIASQMGHEIIVDYLVTVGAEINRATKKGATPLFIASQMGHEKVVHYLATVGADINRAMNNGSTPLYIASQMGHSNIVEYLTTGGTESHRPTDNGATPLTTSSSLPQRSRRIRRAVRRIKNKE